MAAPSRPRQGWRKHAYPALIALVVVGALYSGYLFFSTVRAVFARTSLPRAGEVSGPRGGNENTPREELPDIAGQKEPINILLLGIDQRELETGPWRSDTMILLSIDPATNSASMLSLPRDLWVKIPAHGENRINTAHFFGDATGEPNAGPELAKETVTLNFGIPVHYFVRVNFTGFEKIIDAIGGLTIDVPTRIYDTQYPDESFGYMTIDIPEGVQQMDGKTALQYARSRHTTSDFDRMARQQQVIMAARDKVLGLDIPITRIPELISLVGDSVQTDLSVPEIIALAEIARKIDRANIHQGVIDETMTSTVLTPQGWSVEVPNWAKIRPLLDGLFPASVVSAPLPNITRTQLSNEAARIELQNGSPESTLAQEMAVALRERGFNVIRYDTACRLDQPETTIIVYREKQFTVDALASELRVRPENIQLQLDSQQDADIVVVLGRDVLPAAGV